MKTNEVFDLYKNMMENYDDWIDMHKFPFENAKTLPTLKEIINETIRVLLERTLFNYRGPLSDAEIRKLPYGIMKAAQIAGRANQDIVDFDGYKEKFRETFSTALRFELYRAFIAKSELENNPALIIESTKSFIESEFSKFLKIESELAEFQKASISSLKSDIFLLMEFIQSIEYQATRTSSMQTNDIKIAVLEFELRATAKLQAYKIKYESNVTWYPLIKNFLLIITGIGALFTLYSLGHRALTGHYAFFDKPYLVITNPDDLLINKKHIEEFEKFKLFNSKDSVSTEPNRETELNHLNF